MNSKRTAWKSAVIASAVLLALAALTAWRLATIRKSQRELAVTEYQLNAMTPLLEHLDRETGIIADKQEQAAELAEWQANRKPLASGMARVRDKCPAGINLQRIRMAAELREQSAGETVRSSKMIISGESLGGHESKRVTSYAGILDSDPLLREVFADIEVRQIRRSSRPGSEEGLLFSIGNAP